MVRSKSLTIFPPLRMTIIVLEGVGKTFHFYQTTSILYDDPDDLDEDALALIKRLGKAMLPEYILRERGDKPIKTLRDMVMWLKLGTPISAGELR